MNINDINNFVGLIKFGQNEILSNDCKRTHSNVRECHYRYTRCPKSCQQIVDNALIT